MGRRNRNRHQTPAIQFVDHDEYSKEIGQKPMNFDGETEPRFKNWWMTVKNYIEMNSRAFLDDQRQIRFILGLMVKGKAGDWSEQYYLSRI